MKRAFRASRRRAGAIANHEAESLLWLPLNDLERLDFAIDRIAVSELGRLSGA